MWVQAQSTETNAVKGLKTADPKHRKQTWVWAQYKHTALMMGVYLIFSEPPCHLRRPTTFVHIYPTTQNLTLRKTKHATRLGKPWPVYIRIEKLEQCRLRGVVAIFWDEPRTQHLTHPEHKFEQVCSRNPTNVSYARVQKQKCYKNDNSNPKLFTWEDKPVRFISSQKVVPGTSIPLCRGIAQYFKAQITLQRQLENWKFLSWRVCVLRSEIS